MYTFAVLLLSSNHRTFLKKIRYRIVEKSQVRSVVLNSAYFHNVLDGHIDHPLFSITVKAY